MKLTSANHRTDRMRYQQRALQQGHLAVSSILRDWVKGQVTAIETGTLSFEDVFLPHMLTADGRRLVERLPETGLLPPAEPSQGRPAVGPIKCLTRGLRLLSISERPLPVATAEVILVVVRKLNLGSPQKGTASVPALVQPLL